MKKIIILSLLALFFFSCDENIENENNIQGKWNVTQIIGGFAQPINYNTGDATWFFDFDKKTITIENNVDVFTAYLMPSFTDNQGGIYPFEIITENDIEYLIVGDRKGSIKLENNKLTIDYGIAFDDIAYILKR